LARRLVEAGVRFVNVHWPDVGGGKNWDTHSNGFRRLREGLIPRTDRALSALVSDLAERGLLAKTLVPVLTEFGRAPQIGVTFQNSGGPGGRDHWSNCFSILLAGGGIAGGQVHGSSESTAAPTPGAPSRATSRSARPMSSPPSTRPSGSTPAPSSRTPRGAPTGSAPAGRSANFFKLQGNRVHHAESPILPFSSLRRPHPP
jgi:hypothetical protein